MVPSLISIESIIDPSSFFILKIKGMQDKLDLVAYKTKFKDVGPIADMNSTVSTSLSLIVLIQG